MSGASVTRNGAKLSVVGAEVSYGAVRALDDVSLEVGPNEVVALIGTNGSGKTTLLNSVSGFVPLTSGRICLDGTNLSSLDAPRRARMGVGRTFQHARIVDELSVLSNVLAGAMWPGTWPSILSEWRGSRAWRQRIVQEQERATHILRSCGIEGDLHRSPASLTFGQRKIVDMARALASQPRLLIMDEPTAGLSQNEVNGLHDLVAAASEHASVLLVAHHMGFVSRVADRVVCLESGRVIADGPPKAVQSDPAVVSAYVGTEL
jgi:branched-chain amino acid transport system ATP-binding protein